MWFVRRCRVSSLCRRYLSTILFLVFLFSLSTLLLGTPDIHYNGRAQSDSVHRGLNKLQERIEPPLPVLSQRIAYTNQPEEKSIQRSQQIGRGLLDRLHGDDMQFLSNSRRQQINIEPNSQTANRRFPTRKPDNDASNSQNAIQHNSIVHYNNQNVMKQNGASRDQVKNIVSRDQLNNQNEQKNSASAQYKPIAGAGKDFQNHPEVEQNDIAVSNNAFNNIPNVPNGNIQVNPIASRMPQREPPNHNINGSPVIVQQRKTTQDAHQYNPPQGQQESYPKPNHRKVSKNYVLPDNSLPTNQQPLLHNSANVRAQHDLGPNGVGFPQSMQHHNQQQLQQQYGNLAAVNAGNVQQGILPHQMQPPVKPFNLVQQQMQQQPIRIDLQQQQQTLNQQKQFQQLHEGQKLQIQQEQQYASQQQQIYKRQQQWQVQQQLQQTQQNNHQQIQQLNQQQQPQQQQQQWQVQQQLQQTQQNHHQQIQQLNQQQQPQSQQQRQTQQVQPIQQAQHQRQQGAAQTDLRQNGQQQPPIGQTSGVLQGSNSINSKPIHVQNNADIMWSAEVDQAVPQAFTWDDVDSWTRRVRQQPITVMETGTETKCGRPPNQYLELADGTKLCARYRETFNMGIEGELLSFYLARLLDIRSVPPLVLAITDSQSNQWSAQRSQLTQANWKDGRVVTLTKFIDGLSRTRLPRTLKVVEGAPPLEVTSPELQSLTSSELSSLAQWTDLILFDYLLGHIDRATNHQEGIYLHDDAIQQTIWHNQPIHNLAIGTNSVLWFIDNETGFRMGYRAMYRNSVNGEKYQGFHSTMLRINCVFRPGTVKHIEELYHHPNPFERLMTLIRENEPLADMVKVEIPGVPNDVPELFNERVGHAYKWMDQCRQRLNHQQRNK